MPHEGRGCGGVERDDVMNSSEYHKCMSEVYFTKALLFMLWAAVVLTRASSIPMYFLAGLMALNAIGYFYRSFREFKEANNG